MKNYIKNSKQRVALKIKSIKEYFHNKTDNNTVTNKTFWNFMRLCL